MLMCICAFSLRREFPGRILGDKLLLFLGGSVTTSTVYLGLSLNLNSNSFFEYYLNQVIFSTCKGTLNFFNKSEGF
jgi:hypothetical protein